MTDSRASLKPGWVVLILTALHAGLVFFRLDEHGLWLDEVMSIEAALASWPELWRFFQTLPEQHPLYYLILRPWLFTFGDSPVALRSLTAVFSVATVPALYLFLRQFTDVVPALVATALFALAPFSVFYGQEGRMYSLLLFLVCVSSALWLKVLSPRPPRWARWCYVAAAVAGVYTHFFFAFVVLAHGMLGFAWPNQGGWSSRLRGLTLPTLVGVLYIPWMIVVLLNFPEGQGWKGTAHAVFSVPYTLFRFGMGYTIIAPNHDWQDAILAHFLADWALIFSAFLSFSFLIFLGIRAIHILGDPRRGRTVGLLGVAPVAIPLLLTPVMVLAGERYFLVTYPIFLAVLGIGSSSGLHHPARWIRLITPAAMIVILGIWFTGHVRYFAGQEFGKEGWREAVETIGVSGFDFDRVYHYPARVGPSIRYHMRQKSHGWTLIPLRECIYMPSDPTWLIVSNRGDSTEFLSCLHDNYDILEHDFFPFGAGLHVFRLAGHSHVH